jgi:hypothetical protein
MAIPAILAIPAIVAIRLLSEALVYFSYRQLDLLFTNGVLGRFRLTLQVRLGQPKRLELAYLLGIDFRAAATAAAPLGLTLFDLFLDARFRVDQAFSGITHKSC